MSKKDRIAERNARPYITSYLSTDAPLALTVSIPKNATRTAIRAILRDAAALSGVSL